MLKKSTNETCNAYRKARIKASSCNERLSSREGASEICGIDRTRLARIEIGTKTPYPEEILILADKYNAPELKNWYCSHECPIGKETVPCLTVTNADRAVFNFTAAYINLKRGEAEIEELAIHAAKSGTVTGDFMPLLRRTMERAELLSVRSQELSLWAEKNKEFTEKAGENG